MNTINNEGLEVIIDDNRIQSATDEKQFFYKLCLARSLISELLGFACIKKKITSSLSELILILC